MSTIEDQAEAAWSDHTVGFTWRDDAQRYGEYRMFLAGYLAASRRESSTNVSSHPETDISSGGMSAEQSDTDDIKALVAKLREKPSYWHQPTYEFLHSDAADAIEALESENDRLRIDNLGHVLGHTDAMLRTRLARAEEAARTNAAESDAALEPTRRAAKHRVSEPSDTDERWEYVGDDERVRRFTDNRGVVEKWMARGIKVRRRTKAIPAGEWEVVPDGE